MEKAESLAHYIATIKTLAARLEEQQPDPYQLEPMLEQLETAARKAIYALEDAPSRVAKSVWQSTFGRKKAVPIAAFALALFPDRAAAMRHTFRSGMQLGALRGLYRKEHWYATIDTLVDWFNLSIKRDQKERAFKAAA